MLYTSISIEIPITLPCTDFVPASKAGLYTIWEQNTDILMNRKATRHLFLFELKFMVSHDLFIWFVENNPNPM